MFAWLVSFLTLFVIDFGMGGDSGNPQWSMQIEMSMVISGLDQRRCDLKVILFHP